MGTNADKPSDSGGVQVFELTMDNTEDQDELNRRLRKPGDPDGHTPAQVGGAAPGGSTTEPTNRSS
jgi:hypothetical protein